LAFVRYERPGIGAVHTVPIAGGEPRRLTESTAVSHVAWSPDGRHILYSVDDDVFRIAADSTRIERGHKVLHTSGGGLSMSRPGAGRPGRLAFTEKRTDVGLRLIDLEGARGDVLKSVSRFADSHALTSREGSRGTGNRSRLLLTVRARRKRGWPMPMV